MCQHLKWCMMSLAVFCLLLEMYQSVWSIALVWVLSNAMWDKLRCLQSYTSSSLSSFQEICLWWKSTDGGFRKELYLCQWNPGYSSTDKYEYLDKWTPGLMVCCCLCCTCWVVFAVLSSEGWSHVPIALLFPTRWDWWAHRIPLLSMLGV